MHTGDEFFDSREFKTILEKYNENPSNLDADELTDIADYYSYIGNEDKAIAVVSMAKRMFPDSIAPISFLAHEALNNQNIKEAKRLIEQIIDKSDIEYKLLSIEILVAENHVQEAEGQLQVLMEGMDDERFEDFIIDVANIYLGYNMPEKAEQWLNRNKGCEMAEYKELRAKVLLASERIEECINVFNELIDQNPFSIKYWNALATVQFITGNYEEAINSSDYTLAINPNCPDGLFTKGNSLYHLDRYEEALKCYKRYIQIRPNDELGYLNAGTCLINIEHYEDAIDTLKKSLDIVRSDSMQLSMTYQEIAHSYCALKDFNKALEYIELAEKYTKDLPDILVLKGHILLGMGNLDDGLEALTSATRLSKGNNTIFMRMCVSLYENNYMDLAYQLFEKLFENCLPTFKDGLSYMALCCRDLNKNEEYLHYLKLAIERNPKEAKMIFGQIFPKDLKLKDYYEYAKKQIEN